MWARAVWIEDNKEVEDVVPSNWIKNKILYWPKCMNVKKCYNERKEPEEDWLQFVVVKVKVQGDARSACELYDFSSGEEVRAKVTKRKSTPTKLPSLPTWNSVRRSPRASNSESIRLQTPKSRAVLSSDESPSPVRKSPRSLIRRRAETESSSSRCFMIEKNLSLLSPSSSEDRHNSPARKTSPRKRPIIGRNRMEEQDDTGQKKKCNESASSTGSSHQQRRNGAAYTRDKYPLEVAEFQRKVLYSLVEIKNILLRQSTDRVATIPDFEINRLESTEEFDQLDNELANKDSFKSMVSQLSKVGGENVKEATRNIMKKLMSYAVMSLFNMKGKGTKKGLMEKRIGALIVASVMANKQAANAAEIEKEMASVLKYAPDRDGGTGRNAKSAE